MTKTLYIQNKRSGRIEEIAITMLDGRWFPNWHFNLIDFLTSESDIDGATVNRESDTDFRLVTTAQLDLEKREQE